jgi:hypothetical protein
MASFLGNLNWDKLTDVLGYAAEMHRPGGNVQRYEQNRLAQKILQDKLKEQEAQKAAKARLMGGMDPTTGITWNTGRQAPTSVQRMEIPEELQGVPRVSGKPMDPAMMMEDDQALADARRQFGKQRQADIAQAFPELAEEQLMAQFAPPKMQTVGKTLGRVDADGTFTPVYRDESGDELTAWQRAQIERQDRAAGIQDRRLNQMEQNAQNAAIPKPPQGMRVKAGSDPQNPEFEYIPGSPGDQKRKSMIAADRATVDSTEKSAKIAIDTIDKIVKHPRLPNVIGTVDSVIPPLRDDTGEVKGLIDNIKSRVVVDVLNSLKANSANGSSGFGALSNQEAVILQNAIAALNQATTVDGFKEQLGVLKTFLNDTKSKVRQKYKDEYGEDYAPTVKEVDY